MFGGGSPIFFFSDSGNSNVLGGLLRTSGLTFFKDYAHSTGSLDADYSVGSKTATFTATRSAAAPATYIDANGVIQLTTTSNVGRLQNSYYDTSGVVRQNGLMIESASTNLLTRTDGTASAAGLWTGWTNSNTGLAGTPTKTNPDVTNLINIPNATSQRIQYTGVAGDVNASAANGFLKQTGVAASVASGDVLTFSFLYKSSFIGLTSTQVNIQWRDNASALLSTTVGNIVSNGFFVLFTLTGTAPASTDHADVMFSFSGMDQGDLYDLEICRPQLEKNPYATSFIPTTTTSLTRGAEVLTYPISGNRTAASETIFIKFAPESVFANDGASRFLMDSDGGLDNRRFINKQSTGTSVLISPSNTAGSNASGSTVPQANTSYVFIGIANSASSPYSQAGFNGSIQNTSAVSFLTPTLSGNFQIGASQGTPLFQLNGIIQSVAIYNVALTSSQISQISNILAGN